MLVLLLMCLIRPDCEVLVSGKSVSFSPLKYEIFAVK